NSARPTVCDPRFRVIRRAGTAIARSSKSQFPNPKQISTSKSQSNSIARVLFWSLEFEICLELGIWDFTSASAALNLRVSIPVERRKGRLVFVKDESGNLRQGREPLRLRSG